MEEADKEMEKIKALENEVSGFAQELKKRTKIYFNNKKLVANALAGDIVFENYDSVTGTGVNRGYVVINDKTQEIYRYKDGVYISDGESKIRATAQLVMGDKSTQFFVNEVVHAVKNFLGLRIDRKTFNSYTNLICMQNGVFNTETNELLPFDTKYYFTTKLNVKYDKDAKGERCLQFFKEVHKPEDIPIIQELFGYCLYPTYKYHKIFFFLGGGRNGKGTEIGLLGALLGEENIRAASVEDLTTSPYILATLFGKSANLCGEMGDEPIENSRILKTLSGEDIIDNARNIFGHPFKFKNYAKLVFSMNMPPEIKDRSDAIWNRLIYVDFPNKFMDKDPKTDPDLPEKLTTPDELSGLFNWAIEGLRRLKQNGGFSYNRCVEENMRLYDMKSNPTLAYAQEFLDEVEGCYVFKEVLRSGLNKYCNEHNLKRVPENQLSKKLSDAMPMCFQLE